MKHLILLFDGTWNSAATGHYDSITNVFRLNLAISRHDASGNSQVIFYIPGPGTRGYVDEKLGGAFGQGIDQIIREAYVNLASNYNDDDKIYLFGFSRGAVAARALSCLIAESGLLKPINLHLLPIAWKRFVNINQGKELHPGLEDLTTKVQANVRIEFIGLFDSVLGRSRRRPNGSSDLVFSNQSLTPIVNSAFQILAIDDDRKAFKPLVWDAYDHSTQELEQVWLPGVHGDIGGYGRPHFLSIVSLLTMLARVQLRTGLKLNAEFLEDFGRRLRNCDEIRISDERPNPYWKLLPKALRRPPKDRPRSADKLKHYLHPISKHLHKRRFSIRGTIDIYSGDHLDAYANLEVWDDRLTKEVIEAASDALTSFTNPTVQMRPSCLQ